MNTRRLFVAAVKHSDGDWETYEVSEIRVAQPITVHSDAPGVVVISGGGDEYSPAPQNDG